MVLNTCPCLLGKLSYVEASTMSFDGYNRVVVVYNFLGSTTAE
jgi:hypothetical protein